MSLQCGDDNLITHAFCFSSTLIYVLTETCSTVKKVPRFIIFGIVQPIWQQNRPIKIQQWINQPVWLSMFFLLAFVTRTHLSLSAWFHLIAAIKKRKCEYKLFFYFFCIINIDCINTEYIVHSKIDRISKYTILEYIKINRFFLTIYVTECLKYFSWNSYQSVQSTMRIWDWFRLVWNSNIILWKIVIRPRKRLKGNKQMNWNEMRKKEEEDEYITNRMTEISRQLAALWWRVF